MRRRGAICKFNPADYSRWEGQEGVGLQGGNATGGGREYSVEDGESTPRGIRDGGRLNPRS